MARFIGRGFPSHIHRYKPTVSTSPTARFWIGGSGTWDTSATTHWSLSSGGASGASAPTSVSDVFVDGNSGSPTITISGTVVCRSLTTSGSTCTISYANSASNHIQIGDSLGGAATISATTTFGSLTNSVDALQFISTSSNLNQGWNITTNGATLPSILFNGVGGLWKFQDTLTAGALKFTNGKALYFKNGVTSTLTSLTMDGAFNSSVFLGSLSAGAAATISISSGTYTVSFLDIKDITVTGGATFKAKNCRNISNNTGWTFLTNVIQRISRF